jgi:putative membrane protein
MKFLLNIALHITLSAAALILVAMYVPGIDIAGWQAALVVVFALFVVRYTIKPILMIVSLPINLVTLGLFSFVINGILFFLVAKYVEGFSVATLLAGIVGAFAVSVIKTIGGWVIDTIL